MIDGLGLLNQGCVRAVGQDQKLRVGQLPGHPFGEPEGREVVPLCGDDQAGGLDLAQVWKSVMLVCLLHHRQEQAQV